MCCFFCPAHRTVDSSELPHTRPPPRQTIFSHQRRSKELRSSCPIHLHQTSSLSIVVLPHLSQQEQRHLSCVIYGGGINWTDSDGSTWNLGVPVYSAADNLKDEFRHINGDGGSATNETYKWAEEAATAQHQHILLWGL